MTTPYQPFLVANQRVGTDLSMAPWLIPSDAYHEVTDAYLYRGDVIKRDGYSWFDSMPHAFQGTSGHEYYNISGITTTISAQVTTYGTHGLSNGQLIRLTGVNGIMPGTDGVDINGPRWTVSNASGNTFNINNAVAFAGAYNSSPHDATLSTFPVPGNPIMCISSYLNAESTPITGDFPITNDLIVLDTQRAAIYDTTYNCLVPIGYSRQFTGEANNLFWFENYLGKIYFTNNIDNIFYWDGSQLATGLTAFAPQFTSGTSGDVVNNCLMIKSLNNRLCLYNTNETISSTTANYPTRVRWCQGKIDPTTTGAWFDNVPGSGGDYDDLTGSFNIISQAQIQTNNLIVSQNQQFSVIYEQRNASDIQNPFVFVKIATSRNVNSTFGTIILDREVQMVGNSGLVITDGNSIGRYDEKIPDFAINEISQNNFSNAFGIRNDVLWQSWTLYTSTESISGVNDKILVFNYQDKSFQIYRIPLACAGLFPSPVDSPTWLSYGADFEFRDFDDETWISTQEQAKPLLLGGGYDGNIWNMSTGVGGDASGNVAYGDIIPTGYLENGNPITMELVTRQWFPYAKEGLASQFGYIDLLIDGDPTTVVGISFNVDNETSDYLTSFFTCIPYENLDFSTISGIVQPSNPTEIVSIDHGLVDGQSVYIFAVQGMTQLNGLNATVTVVNANTIRLNGVDNSSFSHYTGGGIISQQPITQNTFWTRINVGQTGVFHTMKLTSQGTDENFKLSASLPWFKPSGRIYKG